MRGARVLAAALLVAAPGQAQQATPLPPLAVAPDPAVPQPQAPQSAVVVLDRDALFATSLFGQRVARDIDAASNDLAGENRRLETELEAEEKALTARRAEMEPETFRELAEEFDARVTEIRSAQDAKARAIAQQRERAQQVFFERANPILVELARETGALVILDRRIVIASADQVDITVLAQTRIDAALGEGDAFRGDAPPHRPDPAPDPARDAASRPEGDTARPDP